MKIPIGIVLAAICVVMHGVAASWEQVPRGVQIPLSRTAETDAGLLRVEVAAENIFRVIAAPGAVYSRRPSLMVVSREWPAVPFTVEEKKGKLRISTARLSAEVNLVTGALRFFDARGRAILREPAGGGKSLQAAEIMGEPVWSVRQIFDSPDDEAFFGLGQHQDGWMNYKGRSLDLRQSNLVAAVPFVVSSRNYGILWDTNSRVKFGDAREFAPLSALQVFDADGNPGGLTAEYFNRNDFTSPLLTRVEPELNYESLQDRPNFPPGFALDRGSVVWSGSIASRESGVHQFRLYCSSYTKMWLDGELVVDAWRQNWLPWQRLVEVPLKVGRRCPLRIEWQSGGGYLGLRVRGPQPQNERGQLALWAEVADQIDYYFIHGANLDEVLAGYRRLTGRAPLPPKTALGFWQSRERYKTQEELLGVVREYRRRGLPLDNIVQDWFYWREDQWGSHEFDPARFPDPRGMADELHDELHARVMISVWPKFYVGTEHYDEFAARGWLYPRNVELGERDWVGRGYVSTFYDPYSSGARKLFWRQIDEHLFKLGIDDWWLDATEPDIHSNLAPDEYLRRIGPTAMGSAARLRNSYALMNARGIYEAQRNAAPNRRVFILTRSAWGGLQRYGAATWSGDVATRWSDLREQIAAGLNFSISGIPYWTTDIGGFAVEPRFVRARDADLEEWRELNVRWFQFGAFCPLFRSHGQFPFREIFNLAPEEHPAYTAMAQAARLRYRLLPYLYSLAGMVTHRDYTLLRPLAMDFPRDQKARNVADQFLCGPALLVNPVTEYRARSRAVYLPRDSQWYDFWKGGRIRGGRTIEADAPYDNIPLYARAGAIVPFGPALQYTDEKPADPLRLLVYCGADGQFELYEDEGVNYNYERGLCSWIPLTYIERERALIIGARRGEFPGMLQARTFEVVWVTPSRGGLNLEAPPDQTVQYRGAEIRLQRR